MKTLKCLLVLISLISLTGCDKEDNENNPDVKTYIELLKTDQYQSSSLPEFSSNDIPTLLKYINDNSAVNKFPHNPISSYINPEPNYKVGIIVIWTIEAIRLAACDDRHILWFPSQHPFIKTKSDPGEWIISHDDEAYEIVRQSYFNWWKKNKHKNLKDFCNINPLENTGYWWH